MKLLTFHRRPCDNGIKLQYAITNQNLQTKRVVAMPKRWTHNPARQQSHNALFFKKGPSGS